MCSKKTHIFMNNLEYLEVELGLQKLINQIQLTFTHKMQE